VIILWMKYRQILVIPLDYFLWMKYRQILVIPLDYFILDGRNFLRLC